MFLWENGCNLMGCRCVRDKESAIISISFKRTIQEMPPRFHGDDFISENSISDVSVIPVAENSKHRIIDDLSFFSNIMQREIPR